MCAKNPYAGEVYESGGMNYDKIMEDGTHLEMALIWLDDSQWEGIFNMFRGLKKPSPIDSVTMDMFIEQSRGYFEGKEPLDTTVSHILDKLNMMASE